jgi:regulatory protein
MGRFSGDYNKVVLRITDITPQQKSKDRFNIYLNGEFAFGLGLELLARNKLKVGSELSDPQIVGLIKQDQTQRLLEKSFKFLSYRPRSEKEVRDQLKNKIRMNKKLSELEAESLETSIEEVIKKLKELHQVDDKEFSHWWLDQRTRFRPRGMRVIRAELLKKGVPREIVEETLQSHGGSGDSERVNEEALALKVAGTKLKRYSNLGSREQKLKLGQYLAARGFSWETVKKVVDTLVNRAVE